MIRTSALAVLALAFLCNVSFAQPPMYQQDQTKTIIAVIKNADPFQRKITVMDAGGRAMELALSGTAEISAWTGEFRTIYDLKPGYQVQVNYIGPEEKPDVTRVVILPGQER